MIAHTIGCPFDPACPCAQAGAAPLALPSRPHRQAPAVPSDVDWLAREDAALEEWIAEHDVVRGPSVFACRCAARTGEPCPTCTREPL